MNSIREIATVFCTSAIFTAAAGMLRGGTLGKSGKYITALVMLCTVLASVVQMKQNFTLPEISVSNIEIEGSESALCEYQAEYMLSELLNENKIVFKEINAIATKTEGGSIVISELTVVDAPDRAAVTDVFEKAGIDCKLYFE